MDDGLLQLLFTVAAVAAVVLEDLIMMVHYAAA